MKFVPLRLTVPLLALPLAAGCSTPGEFPSLARRPAEMRAIGGAAVAPAAPDTAVTQTPVSPQLAERLAQLQESAREAHARFAGRRARAVQLVSAARGAAVASEAWSVATVAVADLESARSDAMVSLGELDRLYVSERIDGGDGAAITAVRDQVTAWVADEDAVLADLGNRLGG